MATVNPRRRAVADVGAESALSLKATSALRKGATFSSPPSSPSSSGTTFATPALPRSQSNLDDVVDANRRRIALTLNDIEETLAMTKNLSISPRSPGSPSLRDESSPMPRGLLDLHSDSTMTKEESRRVLRPRSVRQSRHHASDSGIGSSVASTKDSAEGAAKKKAAAPAITRSAAASTTEALPSLGRKAFNRIHEHTLRPLLEKPSLKAFEPIVLDVPRRIRSKEIICLRDLEKTLIFMAPERAKTAALYLDFCFTSIRCIQATVEYLSDHEQIRPDDRPYTNGYFLDLKEQIYQYGRQLAAAKDKASVDTEMDLDQADEVRLYGGIAENGRPAELIRVKKDGTAISMATGKAIDLDELPIKIKRSLSEQREDEEEIMRSMARRKKNATPEELAPKRCREPGCTKEFKRPCDLTKHEKTHSRPWKCPIGTCRYHEFGWPTEKEMDRHVNDKHSDAPAMYECLFKPCPYKSKRESNCKQHMEKAHGWTYVRTKTNGKKLPSLPGSSAQNTPPLGSVSTPSSTPAYSIPTPPGDQQMHRPSNDFPLYPNDNDWFATYGFQPESLDNMDLMLENPSPSSAASIEQFPPYQNGSTFIINDEDIYAAPVRMPNQMPTPEQLFNKMMPQQMPVYQMQAPVQAPMHVPAPHVAAPLHFSPSGHGNTMLYSPNSLREVDEALEEAYNSDGADFQLYPTKGNHQQPLFNEVPSADLGFSQTSQPEIFQNIDWSNFDCTQFQE